MKTLVTLVSVLVFINAHAAQTNVIDLKRQQAQFKDLQGKEYNVQLVRATLDGVIYSVAGGGGMLKYTNLSSETLTGWGITSNFLAQAGVRAKTKEEVDARFKADYAVKGVELGKQRAYSLALNQAYATYVQRSSAIVDNVKNLQAQADVLAAQIARAKADSDAAWDRYVYTDSSVQSYSVSSSGASHADNEPNRLANARSLDRQIADNQNRLRDLKSQITQAQAECDKELPQIKQTYLDQLEAIKESYSGGAVATPTAQPVSN